MNSARMSERLVTMCASLTLVAVLTGCAGTSVVALNDLCETPYVDISEEAFLQMTPMQQEELLTHQDLYLERCEP